MLRKFQIKGILDRLAGGILSEEAIRDEISRCFSNVDVNTEQLKGLNPPGHYLDDYVNDSILENEGHSPNSELTQKHMLLRAVESDQADAKVLEEILRSYNYGSSIGLKLGLRETRTEDKRYTLMTERGAEVCLYHDGKLFVLSGTAKAKPLDVMPYSAIQKKVSSRPRYWMSRSRFNDWLNDRLYTHRSLNRNLINLVESGELEEGTFLTSSGKILYGDTDEIASHIFELAKKKDLIIRRYSDKDGNIRLPRKRNESQSSESQVRTEGQRYLESLSPSIIQGRIFSDGGSYKAYTIGNITFAEFDLDQHATYLFDASDFSPEGFLSRKDIRENGSLGYITRIIHGDMDSWKKQVDEYIRDSC